MWTINRIDKFRQWSIFTVGILKRLTKILLAKFPFMIRNYYSKYAPMIMLLLPPSDQSFVPINSNHGIVGIVGINEFGKIY
jgi:hypothetical protein